MKKKNYVNPQIRCVQMRKTRALCTSTLQYRITSNRRKQLLENEIVIENELTYGGIDTNGILDPD